MIRFTRLAVTIILILWMSLAKGQSIGAETFIRETVMGVQHGYALNVPGTHHWGIGFIHPSNRLGTGDRHFGNYPFKGMQLLVPLITCDKLNLGAVTKIGLVSQQFLVILPEALGVGRIANNTTPSMKLIYQAFKL